MRAMGTILWALVFSALICQPAFAGKRIALVVGNSTYRNVARLANPVNDAAVIADTFRKANFDVVDARNDLGISEMRRVLRDFGGKARDADIAVIYYAGHGLEVNGMNYLVPVDAQLETDTDVYDEALPLDRVLVAVEPAKQLQLIILDACRDNPFSTRMKRTVASRSVGRGLAQVDLAGANTMIAFAAKAGFTAADGENNSPFALALAAHLTTPGMDLRKAFGYVRDDVMKATNNRQEPFIYGSLGGSDVALVPAPTIAAPPPPPVDPNAGIRSDYELAAKVGTREAWDSFIATYPDGFYAKLAMAQRNKLLAEEARVAAAEKARLADEQAKIATENAKAAEQAKADAQAKAEQQAHIAAEKKKASDDAKLAETERAKAAAQARADQDAELAAAKAKADGETKAVQAAKAAEDARIAAEKQKAIEDAKLVDAERARAAAQAKATEEEAKLAEARIKAEALQQAKAAEDARLAAEARAKAASNDNKPASQQMASLTPPAQTDRVPQPASDVTKQLQSELRRVGCNTGAVDGNWNDAAQRSLSLFNRHAGTTLDVKAASLDSLDVVKGKSGRICPLVCDHGYKADGDTCVKITCKAGYQVGADNSCAKIESDKKPVAGREAPAAQPKQQAPPSQAPAPSRQSQSAGGGQIFCNQAGCQQVRKGCYITGGGRGPMSNGGAQREVCP